MNTLSLRVAAALTTVLTTAFVPTLAQAQTAPPTQYEYRKLAKTLTVNGESSNGTGQGAGQGSGGTPVLGLSTQAVDFGSVATNTTEKRQVVVSNTGNGTLSITRAATVSGAAEFAAGLTTCGSTLAAGADCLLEPTFSPTTTGTFNGVLTFTTTLAGSPHDITLVGTAFNPVSLAAATLPPGTVGQPYSYDFKTLLAVSNETSPTKSLATWEGVGNLPAGLALDTATGVLSGTPSVVEAGASYTVIGTYKNNQGQQVYAIVVNGAVLQAVHISAGFGHTCAVTAEGALFCWGRNNQGQLGNGSTLDSPVPVAVTGMTSDVTNVSVGKTHTCAVRSGGAYCWGENTNGRLGNGNTTFRTTPVGVSSLGAGVLEVAAGNTHTCAIRTGGALSCWGANFNGQLGNGTNADSYVPVSVQGLTSGVTSVSTGQNWSYSFTCAVHNGAAKCWGSNIVSNLGNGTTTSSTIPVTVTNMTGNVTQVSVGSNFACGVAAGAVKCWGNNSYGKLGTGNTTSATTAVTATAAGAGVSKVVTGEEHACALKENGSIVCWGRNNLGQLGDGTTGVQSLTGVLVQGLDGAATSLAAGTYHTCATTLQGMKCWGLDAVGQLGDDASLTNRPTPVDVLGLTSGVASVAAGTNHTCALTTSGSLKCWGMDNFGQLGNDAALTNQPTPVDVLGLPSGVASVAAGEGHTCAVTTSGGLKCWGYDQYGGLGNDASLTNQPTPVDVLGLTSGVASVAAGLSHTCAVTTSGSLKCWGNDAYGQLGNDASLTDQPTPEAVVGLTSGVASVTAGMYHTCAVTNVGGVKCWGRDNEGQLGNDVGLTNQPTPVDVAP